MDRRRFVTKTSMAATAVLLSQYTNVWGEDKGFKTVRTPEDKRKFKSKAVEDLISEVKKNIGNKELAWLFENCFPNTLDTTVDFTTDRYGPDTYVITGDIDAMWLRDSSAQVWPYLPLCTKDEDLKQLIKGVVKRHVKCILWDPYANAFYKDRTKEGPWHKDRTNMKKGVHERKWEIDSLCYPIRLAYGYWKATGDNTIFDANWAAAMNIVVRTFREQQRMDSNGPYHFQRMTEVSTDTVPMSGYGYPVKPNGLICSAFRPSDDATVYSYLIPSNYFAQASLIQMKEMFTATSEKLDMKEYNKLFDSLSAALRTETTAQHKVHGEIYAYETNGFGSINLMDDANVPSLLSLSYLVAGMENDKVYANTRKFVLSADNPFFYKGKAGEGVGGPHVGADYIWPLSIAIRGITSKDDEEIKLCLKMLQNSHAGTGFMHEGFYKDEAKKYTRAWFAWANTLFGEFIWKVYREKPQLLNS